jgi:hypothetical protein
VTSLVNPAVTRPTEDSSAPPAAEVGLESEVGTGAESRPSGAGHIPSWSGWKKQGSVAPGSWLPFPSSFEQSTSRPEQAIEQAEGDVETDRQYLEKIRTIHSYGDAEDLNHAPEGMFQPSKQREPPIKNDLVQQLLSTHEADALLNEYRQMSASFPFVIVPPNITANALHLEKPMLCLAIITAASWQNHKRQMTLDTIYRTELAHRTIISPRRTLGLVQSVLVYLSWYVTMLLEQPCRANNNRYHFVFSHKTQQIFFLHHLVIGLALDIGLHQDYQPLQFPHRPKPTSPSPQNHRERERAFLGCYYLSSMYAPSLRLF